LPVKTTTGLIFKQYNHDKANIDNQGIYFFYQLHKIDESRNMTREAFIKKWLANPAKQYNEQCRDEMRDDLYKVIEYAKQPEIIDWTTSNKATVVPYQCCPVCNGTGRIMGSSYSGAIFETCDVCNGKKIIPMHVIST
jgi:hypothetical protein